MQPSVSIITPTYNSAKFIADTIRSVQAQTFADWELLLIDDCSSDDTISVIKPFLTDDRIKLTRLETNSGAGIARDTGLKGAKGRYIAFLDADDLWLPEKLQKQLDFMKSSREPFTFSFYECIDEAGNRLGKKIEAPRHLSYKQLFFCNFVGNLTGIYDSAHFGKIGISSIRKRQDWIMWLEILKQIKTANPVPETLALYRVRTDSISASKLKLLRYNYKVYRIHHRLNVLFSLACMSIFLFMQILIKPRYAKKV
jgi:teichuronic acid biosynthesis glycosyltransferase TuaG